MHDYRRRPEDLKPDKMQALEALFDKVPILGVIYHQRWEATQIFDTAEDRATAAMALDAWIAAVRETELDWEPFITMLKNHWDGILAYFDHRRSSGPVEGINKASGRKKHTHRSHHAPRDEPITRSVMTTVIPAGRLTRFARSCVAATASAT